MLGLFGEDDEYIPGSDRDGIRGTLASAHIACQIATYAAGHAFFNHDRPDRYMEEVAEQAWVDVKSFLS